MEFEPPQEQKPPAVFQECEVVFHGRRTGGRFDRRCDRFRRSRTTRRASADDLRLRRERTIPRGYSPFVAAVDHILLDDDGTEARRDEPGDSTAGGRTPV